jgi:hypothetical protein
MLARASRSVTRADLHRLLSGSARMNSNSAAHISRVLALRQSYDLRIPSCFRSTFLPPFAPLPLRRVLAPMEVLTPARLSLARRGIPDSHHLNLSVVLCPTTRCLPMSAFFSLVSSRVLGSPPSVSRPRPQAFSASPLPSGVAKTPGRIDFLSYGPTDSPSVALHPAFRRRSYGQLSTSRAFG